MAQGSARLRGRHGKLLKREEGRTNTERNRGRLSRKKEGVRGRLLRLLW
ncbi:hypothetical protein COLO4_32113 [Corchorus olitorius]|uniref:Uncharacterized protein n=1 Tax=Corchorus olitorius TaxID=93759 RepID=A0A1R3H1G9_9ROSI|nr:hypothetical protein COLO4_32113 [Corchorus olitorius]